MGKSVVEFYKNRIRNEWKIAFYSVLIIGMVVHGYKILNPLMNHDSLYNFYSDQNSVGLGRWFLSVACGIGSYFDLTWLNGLLSLVYIACTNVVITVLLSIHNPFVIALSAGLLVAHPGVTETLFFGFTADGYMLGMLLSAVAALVLRIEENRIRYNILGAVLLCLSCAIYQAYVSFSLVLLLVCLLKDIMEDRHCMKEYARYCLKITFFIMISLATYYLIWKACLLMQGREAGNLHGIDAVADLSAFSFSFNWFIRGMINTLQSIAFLLVEWNIFEHDLTLYAALNIVFVLLLCVTLLIIAKKSEVLLTPSKSLLGLICLLALIPVIGMWHFASNSVGYRPMMLVSVSILYIFLAVLCDKWMDARWNYLVAGLLVVIVFNFGIMANISYEYMDKAQKRSLASGIEMMNRVYRLAPMEEIEGIAIVGERCQEVQLGINGPSQKIHMLAHQLETDLLYDRTHTELYLSEILGVDKRLFKVKAYETLAHSEEVRLMGIWPDQDSIKLIGNTAVIKLGD